MNLLSRNQLSWKLTRLSCSPQLVILELHRLLAISGKWCFKWWISHKHHVPPYFGKDFWILQPLSNLSIPKLGVLCYDQPRTLQTFFLKLNCIICFTLSRIRTAVSPKPMKKEWLPKQNNHFFLLHSCELRPSDTHEFKEPCNPF